MTGTRPGESDTGVRRPRIAILGAGPIGLEAALAAAARGYPFRCYEAAPHVGGHVRQWGHVRLFTPWELNVSPRARRRLREAGREPPEGGELPTGSELADRVLEPLATLPEIAPRLRTGVRVVAVSREGMLKHEAPGGDERRSRPFRLLLEDAQGREQVERAQVVLDCTGSYGNPNALGVGGIPAPGERALDGEIHRRIPELGREAEAWAGRTVLVVGAGHSAQTAVRDLAALAEERPGTRVIWALRKRQPGWGRVPDDPLPARDRLTRRAEALAGGASPAVEARRGVEVDALERSGGRVAVRLRRHEGTTEKLEVDRVLGLTGHVGDHGIYRQLQVHECYATSGPMKLSAALLAEGSADCLEQTTYGPETMTNPEPDFFILGEKSYGRNNTFLMRVGWGQVEEVFQLLDSRAGVPG